MIIEVHVPFPIRILIFLWICPGVGLLDHGIALFLVFKGTSMPLFTVARQVLCVYYPPNSIQGVSALHTAWPSLPSDSATWPEKGVSLSLFPHLKVGVIPSLTRIKRDNTKDLDEVHSPNRPRVVVLWFYLSSCITASEAKYLPNLLGPQTVRKQKRYSVFKT